MLGKLFRRKSDNPPTDQTNTGEYNGAGSFQDVLPDNAYNDSQELQENVRAYERAQEANKPQTYEQRNKLNFIVSVLVKYLAHFISALTAISFVVFFGAAQAGINYHEPGKAETVNWISYIAAVLIIGLAAIYNEVRKYGAERDLYQNQAMGWKVTRSAPIVLCVTVVFSLAFSLGGGYFINELATDKSYSITQDAGTQEARIVAEWEADKERINQEAIQKKKRLEEAYGELRKARNNLPSNQRTNYRLMTEKMNAKTAEINSVNPERDQLLTQSDLKYEGKLSNLSVSTASKLDANKGDSGYWMKVAFALVFILEMMGQFSTRFIYRYNAKVEAEGVTFNVIGNQRKEMQRITLQSYMLRNNLQLEGTTSPVMPSQGGGSKPGKIGFQTSRSEAEKEEGMREVLAQLRKEVAEMKKGKSYGDTGAISETGKGGISPPVSSRFSSIKQPRKRKEGVYAKRVDSSHSRGKVLAAYRAIKSAGRNPTHKAISEVVGLSSKQVGHYVRELKQEGVI